MLTLAAFRYRNVMAAQGGPIARIDLGQFPVRGQRMILANATLTPGLGRRQPCALFNGTADGTGVHALPSIASHMAVSEALERWAFAALVHSDRAARYGFDIDPSSTGMSAYPGLFDRQARRRSVLEAIERFSLAAWWEGRAEGRIFDTDWPGVASVAIDGPFGGITVVAYARTQWGGWAYGHAADESFTGAVDRAISELARHDWVLRSWWLSKVAGQPKNPVGLFERRCVYFASDEGHAAFLERIHRKAWGPKPAAEVICDCEVEGPWSPYATVWRFALRPPSDRHIRGGDAYFFL